MSRLLGVTLERVCKAVLLLCLLHFLVAVILYFDVYAQHLAFFSRFSARGPARALHPTASSSTNYSRPNATAPSSGLPEAPSGRPGPTAPVLPPCPDSPPGLGEPAWEGLPLGWAEDWGLGEGLGVSRGSLAPPRWRERAGVPGFEEGLIPACSGPTADRVHLAHAPGAGAEGEPKRAPGRSLHPARLHASPDGGRHHPLSTPGAPPALLAPLPAPHPQAAAAPLRHLRHQPGAWPAAAREPLSTCGCGARGLDAPMGLGHLWVLVPLWLCGHVSVHAAYTYVSVCLDTFACVFRGVRV